MTEIFSETKLEKNMLFIHQCTSAGTSFTANEMQVT